MKNIVILKDLPSNMVEEAIVILKPNMKHETKKLLKNNSQNLEKKAEPKTKKTSKEYIVKEAENLISQYISNLEKPKQLEMTNQKLLAKYNRIKVISVLLGLVGAFGIIVNLI